MIPYVIGLSALSVMMQQALGDTKRRARLNIIRHVLDHVPYDDVPREKVKLPKRQKAHGYREPDYPFKLIDECY